MATTEWSRTSLLAFHDMFFNITKNRREMAKWNASFNFLFLSKQSIAGHQAKAKRATKRVIIQKLPLVSLYRMQHKVGQVVLPWSGVQPVFARPWSSSWMHLKISNKFTYYKSVWAWNNIFPLLHLLGLIPAIMALMKCTCSSWFQFCSRFIALFMYIELSWLRYTQNCDKYTVVLHTLLVQPHTYFVPLQPDLVQQIWNTKPYHLLLSSLAMEQHLVR